MRVRSLRTGLFLVIAVSLFLLSSGDALTTTDVSTLSSGSASQDVDRNKGAQKKRFVANSLLVKLTPQARANLKIKDGDVDPPATGLPSLDDILRKHGVKTFHAITNGNAHRDPTAAVHSWHKLALAGTEKRLDLMETTNDDVLNVTYSGAEPLARLMASLKQEDSVESLTLDYVMETMFVPNDPYYSTPYPTSKFGNIAQWAPQFIGADQAWNTTLGDPSITIAIVDTGVDANHPDLAGKVRLTKNFVKGEKALDLFGHGTHVAGIAAANTNNGIGIAGICGQCSLMSVNVLGANGSGLTSDVAAGIVYSTDFGARVINMSLGSSSRTTLIRDALDYALSNNALPVVAMRSEEH